MKGNIKLIIGVLIGMVISGITVYAAKEVYANNIKYKDTNVESALNDLFDVAENYECKKGHFIMTEDDRVNGKQIANFSPNYFAVYAYNSSAKDFVWYYNKELYTDKVYRFKTNDGSFQLIDISLNFDNSNDQLSVLFSSSNWVNQPVYYMVCK